MSETTYHKSQIIPGNPDSTVYWLEKNGRAMDISSWSIPKGVTVTDETNRHMRNREDHE